MYNYSNPWSKFHKTRQIVINKDKDGNILSVKQIFTESNGLVTLTKIDETEDVELRDFKDNSDHKNKKNHTMENRK